MDHHTGRSANGSATHDVIGEGTLWLVHVTQHHAAVRERGSSKRSTRRNLTCVTSSERNQPQERTRYTRPTDALPKVPSGAGIKWLWLPGGEEAGTGTGRREEPRGPGESRFSIRVVCTGGVTWKSLMLQTCEPRVSAGVAFTAIKTKQNAGTKVKISRSTEAGGSTWTRLLGKCKGSNVWRPSS